MGLFTAAGAAIGSQYAQPYYQAGDDASDQAVNDWNGLTPPQLQKLIASQQQASSLNSYQNDPRLQQAQLNALDQFGQVGKAGYTDQDRAGIAGAMRNVAAANRGQQGALLQRADMQGGLGGANNLTAAMLGQQQQFDQANAAGTNVALQGANRALDAWGQGAQLAGNMQGQNFQQATAKAAANDSINRFNTELSNQANYYNTAQLPQTQFGNDMTVRGAKSAADNQRAQNQYQRGDRTVGQWAGMGSIGDGILNAGGQLAGAMAGNPSAFGMGGGGGQSQGGGSQMSFSQAPQQATADQGMSYDDWKKKFGG